MASTQELLVDSLRDILDAEKQAVKSFPRIARAASSPELKQALQQHLEVTKGQVARLGQIFELLGERAKAKPCRAMQGLVEEAMEHLGEHERGNELDAVLIACAQKVEHYEIASYGTARAMAKAAGHRDAANLLQETLREEGEADKVLTKVALNVYREMVHEEGQSEEGVDQEERSVSKKRAGARGSSKNGNSNASVSRTLRPGKAGTKITTDHDEIRSWAEDRGAHPACVRGTGGKGDTGVLRLDFPGYSGGDSLQEITWDDFFGKFDEQGLALLYQDSTARGQKSNFNKIISRATADVTSHGGRGSARRAARN